MVKSCCAVGCTNRYSKSSSLPFYRFPTHPERRAMWVAAVNRKDWVPTEYSWICGAHFLNGSKSDDPVSPDYVPSVFSYINSPQKRKLESDMKRYDRTVSTKKRRVDISDRMSAAQALLDLSEDGNGSRFCEPHTGTFTSTSMSLSDIELLECSVQGLQEENSKLLREREGLKQNNEKLLRENRMLTETCTQVQEECKTLERSKAESENIAAQASLSQESFLNKDAKVKYYTGLPNYATLIALFHFLSPCVEVGSRSVLSAFQQMIVVLMKLRLNVGDQDIAFRCGVSQSTISRCFNKWIDAMNVRMKPLVKWPEREELMKSMPMDFRKSFRQCVTIIDCFEVFIERPTNVKARAQTWSNYKHHNTVKFLIGIAPQGVITFISKGWGGRVSDIHLTEHCGILDNLMPGDLILADRGFNIHDSVSMYCAEVKLPPFTKGKKQLSKAQVDLSRQLSRVRIHVERVIGVVRQKYTILQSTLPINSIMCSDTEEDSVIDKVVTVCCALCNCCNSVVSFD